MHSCTPVERISCVQHRHINRDEDRTRLPVGAYAKVGEGSQIALS